jgi:hypothetical protein
LDVEAWACAIVILPLVHPVQILIEILADPMKPENIEGRAHVDTRQPIKLSVVVVDFLK